MISLPAACAAQAKELVWSAVSIISMFLYVPPLFVIGVCVLVADCRRQRSGVFDFHKSEASLSPRRHSLSFLAHHGLRCSVLVFVVAYLLSSSCADDQMLPVSASSARVVSFASAAAAAAVALDASNSTIEVRFSNGATPFSGLVEVRRVSTSAPLSPTITTIATTEWGTICTANGYKKRSAYAANVICSQLGYGNFTERSSFANRYPPSSAAERGPRPDGYMSTNASAPIYLDGLNCSAAAISFGSMPGSGSYSPQQRALLRFGMWHLDNCSSQLYPSGEVVSPPRFGDTGCINHADDAGVDCGGIPMRSFEFRLANAELVDGRYSRGLVLMRPLPNLPWGSIYKYYFTRASGDNYKNNLKTICAALGFNNVRAPATASGYGSLRRVSLLNSYTPNRSESAFPSTPRELDTIGGPNYLYGIDCGANATKLSDCAQIEELHSSTFADTDQLGIVCDDAGNMPTRVTLLNGIYPSNGQIHMQMADGSYYYLPRKALLSDVSNVSTANVDALRVICSLAGYPNATAPAFRYVARYADRRFGSTPAPWSSLYCSGGGGGSGASLPNCAPAVDFLVGDEEEFPSGVDCFPDITMSGSSEFRLLNGTTSSNGVVQMRLSTSLGLSQWATIAEPKANNFPLWTAICSELGLSTNGNSIPFIRRNLAMFNGGRTTFSSNQWYNDLGPVMVENLTCKADVIAPRLAISSSSVTDHANRRYMAAHECSVNLPANPFLNAELPSTKALALDCNMFSGRDRSSLSAVFSSFTMTNTNGRMEMKSPAYTNSMSVCTRDANALRILCRLAGYTVSPTQVVRTDTTTVGTGSRPNNYEDQWSLFNNMTCSDPEGTDLSSCTFESFMVESCPDNFARMQCTETPPSSEWQVRLVENGVVGGSRGRLEIKPSSEYGWSTVYGGTLTGSAPLYDPAGRTYLGRSYYYAAVAFCRELGFYDAVNATSYGPEAFGTGTGTVLMTSVNCDYPQTGESYFDMKVSRCRDDYFARPAYSNTHGNDRGIDCYPPYMENFDKWEYRGVSVTGSRSKIFRVEVRENSTMPWGTVANSYNTDAMLSTAATACRTVDPSYDSSKMATFDTTAAYRGTSDQPVVMYRYTCGTTIRKHLSQCSVDKYNYRNFWRSHSLDMVVNCDANVETGRTQWRFTLTQGTKGFLRFSTSGATPSNTLMLATLSTQSVINAMCNSAGYDWYTQFREGKARNVSAPLQKRFPASTYGSPTNPAWLGAASEYAYAYCTGREGETLQQCYFPTTSAPSTSSSLYAVGLDCQVEGVDYSQFEFRLNSTGFSSSSMGRVEFRPNKTAPWGSIRPQWSSDNLALLLNASCRQFGYSYNVKAKSFDLSIYRTAPVYTEQWQCFGGEEETESLRDCIPYSGYAPIAYQYSWSDVFAVACEGYQESTADTLKVRLTKTVPGSVARGVPEVSPYDGAAYAQICGFSYWGYDYADSICAELGYPIDYRSSDAYGGMGVSTKLPLDAEENPSRYVPFYPIFFPASQLQETGELDVAALLNNSMAWMDDFEGYGTAFAEDTYYRYPITFPECRGYQYAMAVMCHEEGTYYYNRSDFQYRVVKVDPINYPKRVRIEMRPNGRSLWGTIYQPYTLFEEGSNELAINVFRTACTMAGYNASKPLRAVVDTPMGIGPVWVSYFRCPAGAVHFQNCSFDAVENFNRDSDHSHDLTVDCEAPTIASRPTWQFRLNASGTGVARKGYGRLEMRPEPTSHWGTVAGWVHGPSACRSAGFTSPDPVNAVTTTGLEPFAVGDQWATMDCGYWSATDTSLDGPVPNHTISQCTAASEVVWRTEYDEIDHGRDIWVDCYPSYKVSLVDGPVPTEGRVLLSVGDWGDSGPLCNDKFDRSREALRVVCWEAGFRNATHGVYESYPDGGDDEAFLMDELSCGVGSSSIANCSFNAPYINDCSPFEQAGVRCVVPTGTATSTATVSNTGSPPSASQTRTVSVSTTQTITQSTSKGSSSRSVTATGSASESLLPMRLSRTVNGTLTASLGEMPTVTETPSFRPVPSGSAGWTYSASPALSLTTDPSARSPSLAPTLSRTITATHSASFGTATIRLAATETLLATDSRTQFASSTDDVSLSPRLSPSKEVTATVSVHPIPPPVLVQPVPEELTATVTTLATAVGGAASAVDAQALAIIGLVDCGSKGVDDSTIANKPNGYRSVSIFAVEDSCHGVLMGNAVVMAIVGGACFIGAVALRASKRAPSVRSAMAMARLPHFFIMISTMVMNSFAVCGTTLLRSDTLSDIQLGGLSWFVAVVIALSYPSLVFLFGSRRLHYIEYNWAPLRRRIAEVILPQCQLDSQFPSVNAFGAVMGGNRRLRAGWTLVSLLSFAATVPIIFAERHSCVPLFSVSAALFFAFAILVAVTLPRRTLVMDMLHVAVLAANGLLMAVSAGLLLSPGTAALEAGSTGLGYFLTLLTVVRAGLQGVAIIIKVLIGQGYVKHVRLRSGEQMERAVRRREARRLRALAADGGAAQQKGKRNVAKNNTQIDLYVGDLELEMLPTAHSAIEDEVAQQQQAQSADHDELLLLDGDSDDDCIDAGLYNVYMRDPTLAVADSDGDEAAARESEMASAASLSSLGRAEASTALFGHSSAGGTANRRHQFRQLAFVHSPISSSSAGGGANSTTPFLRLPVYHSNPLVNLVLSAVRTPPPPIPPPIHEYHAYWWELRPESIFGSDTQTPSAFFDLMELGGGGGPMTLVGGRADGEVEGSFDVSSSSSEGRENRCNGEQVKLQPTSLSAFHSSSSSSSTSGNSYDVDSDLGLFEDSERDDFDDDDPLDVGLPGARPHHDEGESSTAMKASSHTRRGHRNKNNNMNNRIVTNKARSILRDQLSMLRRNNTAAAPALGDATGGGSRENRGAGPAPEAHARDQSSGALINGGNSSSLSFSASASTSASRPFGYGSGSYSFGRFGNLAGLAANEQLLMAATSYSTSASTAITRGGIKPTQHNYNIAASPLVSSKGLDSGAESDSDAIDSDELLDEILMRLPDRSGEAPYTLEEKREQRAGDRSVYRSNRQFRNQVSMETRDRAIRDRLKSEGEAARSLSARN